MINGPALLGANAALLSEVRALFHGAREAGEFDPLRTEPTGAETIVWAGEGSVEGYALLTYAGPGLAAVECLYVLPAHRRRGMGKALVAAAVDAARGQGCKSVLMGLEKSADAMKVLAYSVGFNPTGVIMTKEL